MCDLGMVLGLAMGAAQVAGQADTAAKNQAMVRQQALLDHAANERRYIVESEASQREAHQAALEGDRAKGIVIAQGAGMSGNTAGQQVAEQGRQSALSISNAQSRGKAAAANYALAGHGTEIQARNKINALQVSPLAAFSTIAAGGFQNYGAFG